MPIGSPKYDIALSFLSGDETTAAALYRQLSDSGLEVFFFPRNQDDLAGTDGLETMRTPFLSESRVMVVLYREPWGKTPWTRVEETAIKEACLDKGWERLFFLVMDRSSGLPKWLPSTHVRFNFSDYGLDGAVGAIKARVQEQGGIPKPLTAAKRAEMFKIDEDYRRDKAMLNTLQGLNLVLDEVNALFAAIESRCAELSQDGHLKLRSGTAFQKGNALQECVVTNDLVSLNVVWQQSYSNLLDRSFLAVREFNATGILPSERASRMHVFPPQKVGEVKFHPQLSLSRQLGWTQAEKTNFLSSAELAEVCVIKLLDLIEKRASGKLKPPDM